MKWFVLLAMLTISSASTAKTDSSSVRCIIGTEFNEKLCGDGLNFVYARFQYKEKMDLIQKIFDKPDSLFQIVKSSSFYTKEFNNDFHNSFRREEELSNMIKVIKQHLFCRNKIVLNESNCWGIDTSRSHNGRYTLDAIGHSIVFKEFNDSSGVEFFFYYAKGKWFIDSILKAYKGEYNHED